MRVLETGIAPSTGISETLTSSPLSAWHLTRTDSWNLFSGLYAWPFADLVILSGTVTGSIASTALSTHAMFILTISSPLCPYVFLIAFFIWSKTPSEIGQTPSGQTLKKAAFITEAILANMTY